MGKKKFHLIMIIILCFSGLALHLTGKTIESAIQTISIVLLFIDLSK